MCLKILRLLDYQGLSSFAYRRLLCIACFLLHSDSTRFMIRLAVLEQGRLSGSPAQAASKARERSRPAPRPHISAQGPHAGEAA
jgi:hypothetical protein